MAILVVDDSRAMRMIVLRELRRAGYDTKDVEEAENGAVALERVRLGGIDLVLSDWNMPEVSGMRLLELLRREGNNVPFGFVTSESTPGMHRDALDAGADFVVTKPFSADSLSLQVERCLQGSRQADGLGAAIADEDESFATVLEGLLGRTVSTVAAPPPTLSKPGAVARYRSGTESHRAMLVAELAVVASVGAALSRIPPKQTEEYVRDGAVPDIIAENFHEVANILSKVVPGYEEHWSLEGTSVLPQLGGHVEVWAAEATSWRKPLEVRIDGYPAGRAAFLPW
ncbi:MAG TPA: response regulator [Acidimicrobiales bacterium]|nr:response regulator [Acidimicrobiales bacterium]